MFARMTNWLGVRLVTALGRHDQAGPVKRKLGALFLAHFPGQIACEEFERFVFDYHEGLLPDRQRRRFEFHMRICPMCQSAFATYVRTVELTGRVFEENVDVVPEDVPQELINAMVAARHGTR